MEGADENSNPGSSVQKSNWKNKIRMGPGSFKGSENRSKTFAQNTVSLRRSSSFDAVNSETSAPVRHSVHHTVSLRSNNRPYKAFYFRGRVNNNAASVLTLSNNICACRPVVDPPAVAPVPKTHGRERRSCSQTLSSLCSCLSNNHDSEIEPDKEIEDTDQNSTNLGRTTVGSSFCLSLSNALTGMIIAARSKISRLWTNRSETRDAAIVGLQEISGVVEVAPYGNPFTGEEHDGGPPVLPTPMGRGVMLSERPYTIHTTIEYTHYLVPDLKQITSAPYYWGVMDRYGAEKLLEGKGEGTFLLRDSAQTEYIFSVSFRRYQRTLHARIEQRNDRFSFDSYDPEVFSCSSIIGLIENYKDPSRCLFFEPQLSLPLHRSFTFPLKHLARAVISDSIQYDQVDELPLPKKLKDYIRHYHYKQPVNITTST